MSYPERVTHIQILPCFLSSWSQHDGTQSSTQRKVEEETSKAVADIEEQFNKNRAQVVDKLMDRVVQVKQQLHRNAVKVE